MRKSTFMIIMIILTVLVIGIGLYLIDNVCEYGSLTRSSIEESANNVMSNP